MSWKNWPKKLPLRDWQIRFSVNLFPNMLIFSQRIFFLLLQPKPLVHLIALFHFIFTLCCRKYSVYIIGDKHNSSFCVDHFDVFLNVDDDKISTQLSKLQTLMPHPKYDQQFYWEKTFEFSQSFYFQYFFPVFQE